MALHNSRRLQGGIEREQAQTVVRGNDCGIDRR